WLSDELTKPLDPARSWRVLAQGDVRSETVVVGSGNFSPVSGRPSWPKIEYGQQRSSPPAAGSPAIGRAVVGSWVVSSPSIRPSLRLALRHHAREHRLSRFDLWHFRRR